MRRLLRPREIFLRSDDRVRYLVLSTPRQLAAAGGALALIGWLAFSSIGVLVQEDRLDGKDWELRQAKGAYLDLLAEIGRSYDEFAAFSDRLAARDAVLAELERGSGALGEPASIEEQLRRSQARPAPVFTGHDALQATLRRFGSDLRVLATRNQALNKTVDTLERRLQAAAADKADAVEAERQARLRARQAEVAASLERKRRARVESSIGRLEERIAAAYPAATDERAILDRQVADLRRQLSKADGGETTLEQRIGAVLAALSGMIGQRDVLQSARAQLSARVRDLETRLAALQESHELITRQLADRARSGVARVEKTVAATGLDVDMLLARVGGGGGGPGTGGPYIPVDDRGETPILMASVASLDDAVQRWERLQQILASLPLSPPIDSYYVSSIFGKRTDPMTGKRAMHEGLDLSGPVKSPVLATAPGRVVYAGPRGSYGRMVEIDHGLGIHTRYAHLRKIVVKVGDLVNYRQKIGLLGSSGRSTGPHVHYEVVVDGKPRDPMKFLKAGRYVFKG